MSRLGGHAFAGLVSRIEQVHQAIGGRAFGSIGPVSAPVRIIHNFVPRGAYRAVGTPLSGRRARRTGRFTARRRAGRQPAGRRSPR